MVYKYTKNKGLDAYCKTAERRGRISKTTEKEQSMNAKDAQCTPNPQNTQFSFSAYLDALDKEHIQRDLQPLWDCWDVVLGDEISPLAIPLGHKKKTLIIGCKDGMEMQDLRMYEKEILERVNAFLEKPTFTKIRITLIIDNDSVIQTEKNRAVPVPRPQHQANGFFLNKMDPNSPIARCYAKYVRKKKEE